MNTFGDDYFWRLQLTQMFYIIRYKNHQMAMNAYMLNKLDKTDEKSLERHEKILDRHEKELERHAKAMALMEKLQEQQKSIEQSHIANNQAFQRVAQTVEELERRTRRVRLIDFSPGEKYLVTYSSHEATNPRDTNRVVRDIFDVRTGKVMRDFKGTPDDFAIGGSGGVSGMSWPVFKWGGGKDDKYIARMGKSAISVYETETFSLVDKKSIKVENVMDFIGSPTDSILALFVPELGCGNQPARVSLVQIPSKEELRQKNLFSVSDCKMYWQSNGEYLAVKVDRNVEFLFLIVV